MEYDGSRKTTPPVRNPLSGLLRRCCLRSTRYSRINPGRRIRVKPCVPHPAYTPSQFSSELLIVAIRVGGVRMYVSLIDPLSDYSFRFTPYACLHFTRSSLTTGIKKETVRRSSTNGFRYIVKGLPRTVYPISFANPDRRREQNYII